MISGVLFGATCFIAIVCYGVDWLFNVKVGIVLS